MIERVNLIEREVFYWTYRKMTRIAGLAFGSLLILYLLQSVWVYSARKGVERFTKEVQALQAKRDQVLQEAKGGVAAASPAEVRLRDTFEKTPEWSIVFDDLSRRMPAGLWFVSLKTYETEKASSGRGLVLMGEASSAGEISLFLDLLKKNPLYENAALSTSSREARGTGAVYLYTIDVGIAKGRR